MIAKGEIENVDFQPYENGGTRILKGFMVAGNEGKELSWKLEGRAEVKVSIWASVQSLPPETLCPVSSCQGRFYFVRNWH